MRDIIIIAIVMLAAVVALRRPWIGVLSWTWLSIMNPHRYTYGIAYDAPLAAIAAGSTLIGLLATRERESPFKGAPVTWFAIFIVWLTISWLTGLDPSADYWQWSKVIKIDVMILVGLAVFRTRLQITALVWVVTMSLAILGAKGGIFTILNGGNYRVWGPEGSFIADNNEFALALVMTIPLLRYLQMQTPARWLKNLLLGAMLLCAASALGSQSRGALLAISAMAVLLWWRGKSRLVGGVVMLVVGVALVSFMPDSWTNRMNTIETYDEDASALGRISAWWTAYGIAKDHLFGVGFNAARASLFALYSPMPERIHAAHSIYFQVMGNHGFVGLFFFLGIWVATWFYAAALRRDGAKQPETAWCADLGAMCQVSLLGYAVGGAFLSLAYFDVPYNLMVLVVLARVWVKTRAWEREPVYPAKWWLKLSGLVGQPVVARQESGR